MIPKPVLQKIFAAIRKAFIESDKAKAIIQANISAVTGSRGGKRVICSICLQPTIPKNLELHHSPDSVVPYDKFWYELSVEQYYDRVFNLPVIPICKCCHRKETTDQIKLRKAAKK